MGSCGRRHLLLSICFLQSISIIERQIFDFLGYMWAPILANFFHIIFVIFGIYGIYLLSIKYVIAYLIWNILWIGWNSFLVCFYMDVGILNKDSDILNLGTGSVSWFEVNGYGCKPIYPINITSEDPYRPVRPERVDDCLINYSNVEIIHSILQIIISTLAIMSIISITRLCCTDKNNRLSRIKKNQKQRQSFYSIEFGPAADTVRTGTSGGRHENHHNILNFVDDRSGQLSPKPMTPRRVKRRSIMTRGTTSRQSNTSRRSHHSGTTTNRNSVRNSRRKYHQNPVTKLMDQQHHNMKPFASFTHAENFNLTSSNLKGLNTNLTNNSNNNRNIVPPPIKSSSSSYNNFSTNNSLNSIDPIYYNTSSSVTQLQETWNLPDNSAAMSVNGINVSGGSTGTGGGNAIGGQINPSYQHSTPNINNSEHFIDDTYNNRPPSVRSSYSNFHGTRPSGTSYNTNSENVFVGIGGGGISNPGWNSEQNVSSGQQCANNVLQVTNNVHQNINDSVQPQLPPTRQTASRESLRSMAFLNSGPPAYNLNYHTPPDSETTM